MNVRTRTLGSLLVAVGVFAAGCGGSGGGTTSTTTSDGSVSTIEETGTTVTTLAASGDGAQCTVKVTGDFEAEWTSGGGPSAVGTDYWYSEAALRQQFEVFGPDDRSFEDVMAAGEPVATLLIINCQGDSNHSVSLLATEGMTRADIPFGPGTHSIKGGVLFGAEGTEPFTSIVVAGEDLIWSVVGGTLDITAFDNSRVAGTFTLDLKETMGDDRTAVLDAEFNFSCPEQIC